MSIHKHHERNAKRIFFLSVIVWIIVAIGLVMEYKKRDAIHFGERKSEINRCCTTGIWIINI